MSGSLSTILIFFYTTKLFFTSAKEIFKKNPKTLEFLRDHGSMLNQKFFGGLLKIGGHGCAKKVGYLPENLGSDYQTFSKQVKSKTLIQNQIP